MAVGYHLNISFIIINYAIRAGLCALREQRGCASKIIRRLRRCFPFFPRIQKIPEESLLFHWVTWVLGYHPEVCSIPEGPLLFHLITWVLGYHSEVCSIPEGPLLFHWITWVLGITPKYALFPKGLPLFH